MIGSLISIFLEGARLNAILVAALELGLCDVLSETPSRVDAMAEKTGSSRRGCQAVADGMVAMKLWRVSDGVYENTGLASKWLVADAPDFVGPEHPDLFRAWLPRLAHVTEAVRSGAPRFALDSPETLEFWKILTPSHARTGSTVVATAIEALGLSEGSPHVLDIGGGARGVYARGILGANALARVTQVDWPHINAAAREAVAGEGLGDRFDTIDGDFGSVEFGAESYDLVILSHIMHQESPTSNERLLTKAAAALKPGGRVLIVDWVVEDGRAGPAASLLFNTTMLLLSPGGKSYEKSEIGALLLEVGFGDPTFTTTADFATLACATKLGATCASTRSEQRD